MVERNPSGGLNQDKPFPVPGSGERPRYVDYPFDTSKYFESATVDQYEEALLSASSQIGEAQRKMLRVQYAAPNKTVTASKLARAVGYDGYSSANLHYGRLGKTLAAELGRKPRKQMEQLQHWWSVISTGESTGDGFRWTMRPQFAAALENIGWIGVADRSLPEEMPEEEAASLREGAVREIKVNAYERSTAARR